MPVGCPDQLYTLAVVTGLLTALINYPFLSMRESIRIGIPSLQSAPKSSVSKTRAAVTASTIVFLFRAGVLSRLLILLSTTYSASGWDATEQGRQSNARVADGKRKLHCRLRGPALFHRQSTGHHQRPAVAHSTKCIRRRRCWRSHREHFGSIKFGCKCVGPRIL